MHALRRARTTAFHDGASELVRHLRTPPLLPMRLPPQRLAHPGHGPMSLRMPGPPVRVAAAGNPGTSPPPPPSNGPNPDLASSAQKTLRLLDQGLCLWDPKLANNFCPPAATCHIHTIRHWPFSIFFGTAANSSPSKHQALRRVPPPLPPSPSPSLTFLVCPLGSLHFEGPSVRSTAAQHVALNASSP